MICEQMVRICLEARKIPKKWKAGKVSLLLKSPDKNPDRIESYRPITVLEALYRMFSKIVSSHLTKWLHENKIISEFQKGFISLDNGVQDHNFMLHHLLNEGKRGQRNLVVVFLDVSNCFSSIHPISVCLLLRQIGWLIS